MVFTILTFFVSNGFAKIWHGFVCDLTRIDRIRRIFDVFVDFRPIPPVSGPGQTPGGPWPSGPGRPLGRPRVGPGRVLGGPWAPVKCMFDGGCLNGQGTDPVKNSVKNPVENSVKNSVDLLVIFVVHQTCNSAAEGHTQNFHKKIHWKIHLGNQGRISLTNPTNEMAYNSIPGWGCSPSPGPGPAACPDPAQGLPWTRLGHMGLQNRN